MDHIDEAFWKRLKMKGESETLLRRSFFGGCNVAFLPFLLNAPTSLYELHSPVGGLYEFFAFSDLWSSICVKFDAK